MMYFEVKFPVRYYETDQMAVVHHSNYIRYFEIARNAMMADASQTKEKLESEDSVMTPIVSVHQAERGQPGRQCLRRRVGHPRVHKFQDIPSGSLPREDSEAHREPDGGQVMISIGGVTVSFGGTSLLDNISFHIGENDKIGLVGKNGAGKSTLMKLIVGEQQPSSGHIEMPSDISIGYLPQIMMHSRGKTVMEEALTAFSHIHRMEAEIESVSSALASRTDYESSEYEALINRLNTLNDRLSLEGGEAPEVRAAKTLFGLGFREEAGDLLSLIKRNALIPVIVRPAEDSCVLLEGQRALFAEEMYLANLSISSPLRCSG